MLKSSLIVSIFLIFLNTVQADKVYSGEQISVIMTVSGDIKGIYKFSGILGTSIKAISENPDHVCEFTGLFRKSKYRGKISVEMWPELDCTIEGQKSSYKTHRIHLALESSSQRIKLPMQAEKLKNVQLDFQELSLKSSKK